MTGAEDREARLAVESMARRIREAREAPDEDAGLIAAEFFAILRSRGWRWVESLAPHRQQHARAGHLDPDVKAALVAKAIASPLNRHGGNYQERRPTGPIPAIPAIPANQEGTE